MNDLLGVASIIAVVFANFPYWIIRTPSETLKTKQQVGQTGQSNADVLKGIYIERGVSGIIQELYSTYLPNLLYALPADITKFFAYEVLTEMLYGRKFGGEKIAGIDGAVAGIYFVCIFFNAINNFNTIFYSLIIILTTHL